MSWRDLVKEVMDKQESLDKEIAFLENQIDQTKLMHRVEMSEKLKAYKFIVKQETKLRTKSEVLNLKKQIHHKKLQVKDLERQLNIGIVEFVKDPDGEKEPLRSEQDYGYGAVSWKTFSLENK